MNSFVKLSPTCLFTLMMLCLSACSSDPLESWHGPIQSLGMTDRHRLTRSGTWVLTPEVRVYVALPTDSKFDLELHDQLVSRFGRYYPHIHGGAERESLAAALVKARQAGLDVVVYPSITDRQIKQIGTHMIRGEVSARETQPGRFDMNLGLYGVSAGQKVDHLQFESRAGVFTAREEDVLWQPLDAYLRLLSQY